MTEQELAERTARAMVDLSSIAGDAVSSFVEWLDRNDLGREDAAPTAFMISFQGGVFATLSVLQDLAQRSADAARRVNEDHGRT